MHFSLHSLSALLLAGSGLASLPQRRPSSNGQNARGLQPGQHDAARRLSRRQSVFDGSNIQVVGQNGLEVTTLRPEHNLTGVDAAHARGLFGTGVKVGVLETNFRIDSPGLAQMNFTTRSTINDTDASTIDPACELPHGTEMIGVWAARDVVDGFDVLGVAPDAEYQLVRIANCSDLSLQDEDWPRIFGKDVKGKGFDIVQMSYSRRDKEYPEGK